MNNLTYFPYERPNYYHGKLLTENDFIKEQQYLNDKRRLHNRFFHGSGVVAGLRVLMVNENSISLEDGVGIDFSGREIVVASPQVYKLSAIEGFVKMAEEYQVDDVYLCIEYDEMSDTASLSPLSNQETKCKEGYRLYLTSTEPNPVDYGLEHRMNVTRKLFEDDFLKIEQIYSKVAVSGDLLKTSVKITNKGNISQFDISITETFEGAFYQQNPQYTFQFHHVVLERGQSQEESITLRTKRLDHGAIHMSIVPQQVNIAINSIHTSIMREHIDIEIPVTHHSMMEMIQKDYMEHTMEDIVTNNYPRGIYLAKILLIKQGTSYKIEKVVPMPFQQYVYSNPLIVGMLQEMQRNMRLATGQEVKSEPISLKKPEKESETGFIEIPITFPAKANQSFFSHEVFHNLGTGVFDVSVASCESDFIYSGEQDIFPEKLVKAKFAVKQNLKTASFVVGAKLLENTTENKVVLSYVVTKRQEKQENTQVYITLSPTKLELLRGESYCIEALCVGIPSATILWSVSDTFGGSIASDGTYTAPNHEGVFEVTAVCQENPSLKASLFVLVRE